MILVDTSVWVEHLRVGSRDVIGLLDRGQVMTHPHVIGELGLGNLRARDAVLGALRGLPRARVIEDPEVLGLVEREQLYGTGIGWVDAHLLASTMQTPGARLWTLDRRPHRVASRLALAA